MLSKKDSIVKEPEAAVTQYISTQTWLQQAIYSGFSLARTQLSDQWRALHYLNWIRPFDKFVQV